MVSFADKPLLVVQTTAEWERWIIDDGHVDGVRLKLRKKLSTAPGITYDEALEVALCHGWIDGQVARFDEDYTVQAFTPRRRASPWSQRNVGIVERLIAEGRMRPGGQAEIDRAKADGRWDAAYRQSTAPVPDELQAALDANPAAAEFFAASTRRTAGASCSASASSSARRAGNATSPSTSRCSRGARSCSDARSIGADRSPRGPVWRRVRRRGTRVMSSLPRKDPPRCPAST